MTALTVSLKASLGATVDVTSQSANRYRWLAAGSMTLDVYADLFDADLDDVAVNLDAAIRAAADEARRDTTQ
jgi:hypothetical protein